MGGGLGTDLEEALDSEGLLLLLLEGVELGRSWREGLGYV